MMTSVSGSTTKTVPSKLVWYRYVKGKFSNSNRKYIFLNITNIIMYVRMNIILKSIGRSASVLK